MRKVIAIFLLFLFFLSGCRSTKYVPEGEYLLNNVVIKSDNPEIKETNIEPFVKQKANTKIFKVKFRLWLYNRAPKKRNGWIARSLRKGGEAPIVYDENRTIQSEREIVHHLSNKGFPNAEVSSSTKTNERKRKTTLTYHLKCNTPYRIASTSVEVQDTSIAQIIYADSAKSLIKEGNLFDLDVLDEERERITAKLKNSGYYNFNKDVFSFMVDTTIGDYLVKDVLKLKVDSVNPQKSYDQYNINTIQFIVGYDAQKALTNAKTYLEKMDSVIFKDLCFLSEGKIKVKPEIIYRNNLLKPGMVYSKRLSDQTHALLSAIGIIRYVNINYTVNKNNTLDCNIYISLAEPQSFTSELELTNISGHFGGGVNLGYSHKNLFRGAEQLNINGTTGIEAIIAIDDGEATYAKEFGVNADLILPKFVFPFLNENFKQKSKAQTKFGTSLDYQDRPEYVRTIATADMTYNWQKSRKIKHSYTPVLLNLVRISEITDKFHEHIDSTEYLKYSYQDHIIFGSRYGITLQGGQEEKKNNRYLRLMVESSGNMLSTFNSINNNEKENIINETTQEIEDSYYNFLDVRYSQYIKFDATAVLNQFINESNTIVYRAQFGIGIPYGNSTQLPFEKRYFGGGASGVRAWMVRSLGPGSYINEEVDYYNQSGDINFLVSAEYRFNLTGKFEGTLFADAGNTWTISDYEDQSGAAFEFDSFYKQIAVGVGTGLRYDLSFLIFRLDVAWKTIDPTQPKGSRWVLGNDLKPTTHIAIGYPF